MRYTTSDGVSIAFNVYGSGTPLLLLHGALVDRAYWQPQIAELSRMYRLIIPDFRWNAAAPVDYPVDRLSQDILELLNYLELDQVDICGHSLGGSVSVQLALNSGQRVGKLILLECAPKYPIQGIVLQLLKTTILLTPLGMLARSMRNLTYNEDLKAYIVEQVKILGKEKYLALLQSQVNYNFEHRLSDIQQPILLMRGSAQSRLTKPNLAMKKQLPHAHTQVIPHAGHMANWDNVPAFNQAVLEHLAQDERVFAI